MMLENAAQSMSCDQSAASEDGALFSNDIAVLYGSNESRSSICADCAEASGTSPLKNDWVGNATNTQILIDPMLNTTGGIQSHSCQSSTCTVIQSLNASQCQGVVLWFPCASPSGAELLKAVLGERSTGCSAHVHGNSTSCLPEVTSACSSRDAGSQHADLSFQATKPCHGYDRCPAPSNGTLDPSTLSVCAETTNISQPPFKCDFPACKQYFKRQRNLDRHRRKHMGERLHVCWVPGCQRSFSRSDNLKAHYTTHGRHGGRNRYVATLDKTAPVFDPYFRGLLTPQGWPFSDAA